MYYIKYTNKTVYGDDCYISIPAFQVVETIEDVVKNLQDFFSCDCPKELSQALNNCETFNIEVGEYYYGDKLYA